MPEHGGKRLPDQAGQGRRLGFLGLGLNRVNSITPDGVGALSRTTADRTKITYARTEHLGDPDDAISWQSSAE
jgi:hypothetical protein